MILVTGGAGYIGSELVRTLLSRNHKVRVLDKLMFGIEPILEIKDRIDLRIGDIRNPPKDIMEDISCVIHLAGLSNDPTSEYNPDANRDINYIGTVNLAEMAKIENVPRFIFASSCSVYYSLDPNDNLKTEDTEVNPTAPYSWSKRMAEIELSKMKTNTFHPVMLRKGTIFGQSHRMRYDLVLNTFTKCAYQNRSLTVLSGGEMWRPMLNIKDAIEAYIKCATCPAEQVSGQIFNVLHKNYRILELAHWEKYVLKNNCNTNISIDVDYATNVPPRSYRVSGEKIEKSLDYKTRNGASEAIIEMWKNLEKGIDISDPIYYNIKWVEKLLEMEKRLKQIGSVF